MDTYVPRLIPKEQSLVTPPPFPSPYLATAATPLPPSIPVPAADIPSTPSHRLLNRPPLTSRPVHYRTSLVPHASGSAYAERGSTKVFCTIHGPRATRKLQFSEKARFRVDVKFAPFASERRRTRGLTDQEKSLSYTLSDCFTKAIPLESYPKSIIECFLLVIDHGDADFLSLALSTISLALADAGIQLFDLILGQKAIYLSESDQRIRYTGEFSALKTPYPTGIYMDPTPLETRLCNGEMIIGYMPNLKQIVYLHQMGPFHTCNSNSSSSSDDNKNIAANTASNTDMLDQCMDLLVSQCEDEYQSMKICLIESAKKKWKDRIEKEKRENDMKSMMIMDTIKQDGAANGDDQDM